MTNLQISFQEATIHASNEDLSVYELVERGNTTDINENQNSGTIDSDFMKPFHAQEYLSSIKVT